ncbi:serine hydrolase [Chitinophaga lutea]
MKKILNLGLCFFLLCADGYGRQGEDLPAGVRQSIDSFLRQAADHGLFSGGVLIAQNGRIIYEYAAGYADRAGKVPNSPERCFNLASVSKPFTSLAVLQQVQAGRCRLSDPVAQYLTDFPYPGITIRHLLTHTGGLPQVERFMQAEIDKDKGRVFTSRELYEYLLAQKGRSLSEPGAQWAYSNISYVTAALLVEKLSGMTFPVYMKRHVFDPAGMTVSRVNGSEGCVRRYIIPRWYNAGSGYMAVDSLFGKDVYTHGNFRNGYGPSNLHCSLRDLARFDGALFSGRLVDTALLHDAFRPTVLNGGQKRMYGMGWNIVYNPYGDTVLYHDGHIPGMLAMMMHSQRGGQTIFFYDNNDSRQFFEKVNGIYHLLNGRAARPLNTRHSLARAYGHALVTSTPDDAAVTFRRLRADTANYYLDEMELNGLGYDLLLHDDVPNGRRLSCEVFGLMTALYPQSANAFDSYAEALAKNGQKENAIAMYRHSLALNPNNQQGRRNLEKLLQP